ncbi:MAG: PPC domain-containing protein [Gemmataceae bacterium]|nr:PPC domain-containing protein [Gemmataceae bacterium]
MRRLLQGACLPILLLSLPPTVAQEKKPPKTEAPAVAVAIPLGIAPGAKTKVAIRGLKLDVASEVRFFDPRVEVKILSKGKSAPPQKQEPAQVGDTQLEAEIILPAGMPVSDASFVIIAPTGMSAPHRLLINGEPAPVPEKEPNNGFRQAQPVQVPQTIDGAISQSQDVDVFRFEGQAGQRILCEVLAARHGSALDSILTLYDAKGNTVATNDDHNDSADSLIDITLPAAGTYYLSLTDAHDQGGPAHVYRLSIRAPK